MAEIEEKWPENILGKFYVDEQCIDCDLCRETAPDFFMRNEEGGYSYVYKQPDSEEGANYVSKLWKVAQLRQSEMTAIKSKIAKSLV